MKLNSKRFVSFVLASSLVLSLFGGCSVKATPASSAMEMEAESSSRAPAAAAITIPTVEEAEESRILEEEARQAELAAKMMSFCELPCDFRNLPSPVSYGDWGDEVNALQRALLAIGYDVEVNGVYDDDTEDAVLEYQDSIDLPADGDVDEDIWQKLLADLVYEYSDTDPEQMEEVALESEGWVVLFLQARLQQLGYDTPLTGYFDAKTHVNVMYFQMTNGLDGDGMVGYNTWKALLKDKPKEYSYVERLSKEEPLDIEEVPEAMTDNLFLDALSYLGYGIDLQRDNGQLFQRHSYGVDLVRTGIFPDNLGVLSDIQYIRGYDYDSFACMATDEDGLPDLAYMRQNGMVCSSYIAYVYFNYLPNVLGIDTSDYVQPLEPATAPSIYAIAIGGNDHEQEVTTWVDAGLARTIDFRQEEDGTLYPEEEVPFGSLIIFLDKTLDEVTNETGSFQISHVALYAGSYDNGTNNGKPVTFVTQIGSKGPEISSVEPMYLMDNEDACKVYAIVVPKFVDDIASGKIKIDPETGRAEGAAEPAVSTRSAEPDRSADSEASDETADEDEIPTNDDEDMDPEWEEE